MVKNLASKFQNIDIKQVPREDNIEVDGLDNLGSAFKIYPYIMTPTFHVIKRTTIDIKEKVVPFQDLGSRYPRSKDLNYDNIKTNDFTPEGSVPFITSWTSPIF